MISTFLHLSDTSGGFQTFTLVEGSLLKARLSFLHETENLGVSALRALVSPKKNVNGGRGTGAEPLL